MRVLLDEQIDRRLKRLIDSDFEVWTVAERGWKGKKNGELLRATVDAFDLFVTMDRGIEHQQNWRTMDIGIVLISAKTNRYADMEPLMPEVNQALRTLLPGQLMHISGTIGGSLRPGG